MRLMDTERRRVRRRNALKTGTLFSAEGQHCLDCLIWDLSTLGAMIEVEPKAEVSETGRLISEPLTVDRKYRQIWRDGRIIGVEFEA
jgi:hypothetical protein